MTAAIEIAVLSVAPKASVSGDGSLSRSGGKHIEESKNIVHVVEILIDDSRTIEQVQNDFSEEYPFLKIEFLSSSAKGAASSARPEVLPKNKKLSSFREKHNSGSVSIEPNRTVRELLDTLDKEYGLRAQVYRKFGNMWIETGLTSHWSLSLQNTEGYEISEAFAKK